MAVLIPRVAPMLAAGKLLMLVPVGNPIVTKSVELMISAIVISKVIVYCLLTTICCPLLSEIENALESITLGSRPVT